MDNLETPVKKICKKCKQEKLITEYRGCNKTKDKHVYICRSCQDAVLIPSRRLKRAWKMKRFLEILPQKKGMLGETYKEIGNVSTYMSAANGASEFLKNPKNDFDLVKSLMEPDVQKLCNDYFYEALKNGKLCDKNSAVALLSKLTGQTIERSEAKVTTITPEARSEKLKKIAELQEDVVDLIEYKKKVNE